MSELALLPTQEVTLELLNDMWSSMPDDETAEFLDARMRLLEKNQKRHFIELGIIGMEMETRGLYTKIKDPETGEGFTSLGKWIANSAPVSKSSFYASMKAIKELKDIPVTDLLEMPRDNINTLIYTSSSVRTKPEIIQAAKEKPSDFKKYLCEKEPNQHMEVLGKVVFHFTKSLQDLSEEAIVKAMKFEQCATREEAMEAIFTNYLNTNDLWKEEI